MGAINRYVISGTPVAQGRPRATSRGSHATVYEPKKSKEYKASASFQVKMQNPFKIEEGPVSVRLEFYMPRPKSLKKSVEKHVKKPDIDNLAKCVLDAMNGMLWHDDSQIIYLVCIKEYVKIGNEPSTVITVWQTQ